MSAPAPPPYAYQKWPPPTYPPQQPNYGTYQPAGHVHTNNTTVVIGQPQAVPRVTIVQRKPDNYIALSIFTLLCCCWIFGIVALIFALQVDSAYSGGDVVGAMSASRSSRTWNIVGIVFGSITLVLVVIANVIWIPIVVVANENENEYEYYD